MKSERGFSLLELVVTVLVLGVVAAMAAPSFTRMMLRNRLNAAANELVAGLQTARMEAIRTNARADMCPSTDGSTCAGSNWGRFIVLSRKNGTDTVVRDVELNTASLSIIGSSNVTASDPNRIWFMADGFVRTGTAAAPTRTASLGVCTTRLPAGNALDVQVDVSRISVAPPATARATCAAPPN